MTNPPTEGRTGDLSSWGLVTLIAVAVSLLGWRDPFAVAPDRAVLPAFGIGALVAVTMVGRRWGWPRLTAAGTAFLQLTLFTIGGVVLSYMLAARGGPSWDPVLASADATLGLDWPAIRAAVDRSNALVWLLGVAYNGLVPQMVVVVVALSCLSRFEALRITVAAAILSGLVTILISGLIPATGNLFDPAAYRHLWAPVALTQAPLISGLRDGSVRVLDLGAMQGIITFPSYHAALAAIFIYAFRAVPKLALPGALWAGLTIVATPLGGGHYAVDVLAGLALAPASLWAAKRLVHLRAPRLSWGRPHWRAWAALKDQVGARPEPSLRPD